jgi:hypothetical protein
MNMSIHAIAPLAGISLVGPAAIGTAQSQAGQPSPHVQAEAPTDPVQRQRVAGAGRRFLALGPLLLAQGGNYRGIMDAASGEAGGGHHDGCSVVT